MSSGELLWWRIERSADGKLTSRVVESAGTATADVFFFLAGSQEDAERQVSNQHAARQMRRKREEWRAAGLCTKCGRTRDVDGAKLCNTCLIAKRVEAARRHRRDRGEVVPVPTRMESLERNRAIEKSDVRRDTLREVLRRYCAVPKGDFMRWLQAEIQKLAGRDAA